MDEYKGVMVYCETMEGKIAPVANELLGGGRKLANALGEKLTAVLIGKDISYLAQGPIAYGADNVYVVDHPLLKDYQTDPYVSVMEKLVGQTMPRILLMGQTAIGRDLAPKLAFRLGTGASLDCLDLSIDPGSKRLMMTRPVYGGNALATFTCDFKPQIAAVRSKALPPLGPDSSRRGEVIAFAADLDESVIRTRVVEKVTEEVVGIKLEDAEVIVCGGRGIGSAEGFKELEDLAKALKGAVAATRSACDNGWAPLGSQIGITGKIVAPDLYIGIGLSGSSQHLSGCSGAKNIIAINRDPEANLFNVARFGVVGDWNRVLPAFRNALFPK